MDGNKPFSCYLSRVINSGARPTLSLSSIFAKENPSKKGLSPAGKISGSNRETDRLHNFGGNAINHQRPWFLKRKRSKLPFGLYFLMLWFFCLCQKGWRQENEKFVWSALKLIKGRKEQERQKNGINSSRRPDFPISPLILLLSSIYNFY